MTADDFAGGIAVQHDDAEGRAEPMGGGDEVIQRVRSSLDLVEIVASEVSRAFDSRVDFDELLAAGREGLFEAAGRFDPNRGASFRTYASYRIEGAIIDSVRRSLQLPRRAHERIAALEAASRDSEGEYSSARRDTAIWRSTKFPEDLINDELATMATAAGMSTELSRSESLADANGTPEEAYGRAELMAMVEAAIAELSEYEARVIKLYFFEEKSHDAAAEAMNVSKAWAHRLCTRAIAKLTKRFRQGGTN